MRRPELMVALSPYHPLHQGHLLPLDITGEDGENLVSLSIMGSAGREEKEECVRMLVRRTGVEGSDAGELNARPLSG